MIDDNRRVTQMHTVPVVVKRGHQLMGNLGIYPAAYQYFFSI